MIVALGCTGRTAGGARCVRRAPGNTAVGEAGAATATLVGAAGDKALSFDICYGRIRSTTFNGAGSWIDERPAERWNLGLKCAVCQWGGGLQPEGTINQPRLQFD